MSSRIEQIIEEIEEFVDSCKYQPLSTTKIVVNKEELEELLRELRLKTPDEVKRYQKIIGNKEAILDDAKEKADSMLADAQRQVDDMLTDADAKVKQMISQHEIMQQAYEQANETVMAANKQAQEIVDEATEDANNIRMGAIGYTDSMLGNMESILATAINEANEKYQEYVASIQQCLETAINEANEKYTDYISSIQNCYEIVSQNRSELNVPAEESEGTSALQMEIRDDLEDEE